MSAARVPVSVVVPTVGRMQLMCDCLDSLARCDPRPDEVIVVDQSGDDHVRETVMSVCGPEFRTLECERRGVAHGTNVGLTSARNDVVLVTHDDCTVSSSWVGTAWALMNEDPERIVTGRVLPGGEADHVPSTIDMPVAREYAHPIDFSVLYPANMALPRRLTLDIGAFDERIPFAEDNDFCYRWLRTGHRMRYEPSLVVTHHDWRSDHELETLYVNYAIGQGVFYAKHLRRRDSYIARRALRDLYLGCRGLAARVLHGRPRWSDWRQGMLRGLPIGLVRGWRTFGRNGAGRA